MFHRFTIPTWAPLCVCALLTAIAKPALADTVLVVGLHGVEAYEGGLSGSSTLSGGFLTPGTLSSSPQTGADAANRNATSHSRSSYSVASTGFSLYDIDLQRPGNVVYAYNRSSLTIDFTVTTDTLYSMSGSFPFSTPQASISYSLADLGTAEAVFAGYESSSKAFGSSSGTFTVGGPQSGEAYDFTGSLTGTLLAGHQYEWTASAFLQLAPLPPSSDSGATSTGGRFDLQLTPIVVPLPKTASAGLVLFTILVAARLLNNRRAARAA